MYFKVQGRSFGNQLNRKNPSLIRIYYIDKIAAIVLSGRGPKDRLRDGHGAWCLALGLYEDHRGWRLELELCEIHGG